MFPKFEFNTPYFMKRWCGMQVRFLFFFPAFFDDAWYHVNDSWILHFIKHLSMCSLVVVAIHRVDRSQWSKG